jgi:hypothetical protein
MVASLVAADTHKKKTCLGASPLAVACSASIVVRDSAGSGAELGYDTTESFNLGCSVKQCCLNEMPHNESEAMGVFETKCIKK